MTSNSTIRVVIHSRGGSHAEAAYEQAVFHAPDSATADRWQESLKQLSDDYFTITSPNSNPEHATENPLTFDTWVIQQYLEGSVPTPSRTKGTRVEIPVGRLCLVVTLAHDEPAPHGHPGYTQVYVYIEDHDVELLCDKVVVAQGCDDTWDWLVAHS